jgi:hypothetical protein
VWRIHLGFAVMLGFLIEHITDLEGSLANTDGDLAERNFTKFQKNDRFEFADAWGNPLVYYYHRDYGTPVEYQRYRRRDGKDFDCPPMKSPKTGRFYNPDSFQLYSLGADGLPGTDDDIANWYPD